MGAPCRGCGVATTGPTTRRDHIFGAYEVGTCAQCLTLDFDRPGAAVRATLRILGKRETDDTLAANVFLEAGLDVAHLLYEGDHRPHPQRKPWGHVRQEHKDALRAAYVDVLDARIHAATDHDRPVPATAPPSGPGGCLACGVGTSTGWRPVSTRVFTRGPDCLDGHLCSTCADVHDAVGALGETFLERAVMEAQGLSWEETAQVPGLKAWIATGRAPGEPWAWVRVRPAPPALDPLSALQLQVTDLAAEVAALRAGR